MATVECCSTLEGFEAYFTLSHLIILYKKQKRKEEEGIQNTALAT